MLICIESHLVSMRWIGVMIYMYEAMTPQCGRWMVQVLVVRVDIGVVTYEAKTPQCGRSMVQVLVIRVDIGVSNL